MCRTYEMSGSPPVVQFVWGIETIGVEAIRFEISSVLPSARMPGCGYLTIPVTLVRLRSQRFRERQRSGKNGGRFDPFCKRKVSVGPLL